MTQLNFGPVANTYPVWSPDGRWVANASLRAATSSIYCKLADGSGAEEMLVSDAGGEALIPSDWSRDGKTLFYTTGLQTGDQTIWALRLDGERKARLVVAQPTERCPPTADGSLIRCSRDGQKSMWWRTVAAKASRRSHPMAGGCRSGSKTAKNSTTWMARNPSWLSRSRTFLPLPNPVR